MMTFSKQNTTHALVYSFFGTTLLVAMYFVIEPQVGQAVTGPDFSIRQEIGAEISFLVNAPNVTMTGPLNGLTGGNATGTTQAVVRSNNATGYSMTLSFSDTDGDGHIMRRDLGGVSSGAIRNYATSSAPYNRMVEPSFGFSFASSASMFAYTVTASNTGDIDQSFLNDGVACNAGAGVGADLCWMAPTTTPFEIIRRTTSAPTGSTSTVRFRVYVPSSPNPGLETGFYTATATLSAVNL